MHQKSIELRLTEEGRHQVTGILQINFDSESHADDYFRAGGSLVARAKDNGIEFCWESGQAPSDARPQNE